MKKMILLIFMALGLSMTNSMETNASTINSKAGIVDSEGYRLNVRSSASTSSTIKTKLNDKSYLTILSQSGNWYYVEYQENSFGYVHKDYVDVVSKNVKQVNTEGSNLNVRYGPSTNYYSFEKIKDKDYVMVLSDKGGWSNILFEGNKVGFVSNEYLKSISTGVSYTYPSKQLSIINYKQFDSRWANLKIGSSGKTMQQIGCLTTSMSMVESYRQGKTITPADIRNSFSYTSDGSMYWPSNYTQSSNSNYTSTMYNLLKQGKPILLGLKNGSDGQHWVVVTGFTGGNSLSLNNFIVNDPGSSSNTRLNQVTTKYPYFYKIAYYK